MLQTPTEFVPLMTAQCHPDPIAFVFRGGKLLVREDDLTLPDARIGMPVHGLDAGQFHPVGLWQDRYCGHCANPLQLASGERAFKCPACGMIAYPRRSPAMMVLIKKGDEILLARHTISPTGRFSALVRPQRCAAGGAPRRVHLQRAAQCQLAMAA